MEVLKGSEGLDQIEDLKRSEGIDQSRRSKGNWRHRSKWKI
jgi:hypothetical protein